MKFFTFISVFFIFYLDIELVLRIFTSPILFHHPLQIHLAVKFETIIFLEITSSPDKCLVLVILMVWIVKLRFHAENYHAIIH